MRPRRALAPVSLITRLSFTYTRIFVIRPPRGVCAFRRSLRLSTQPRPVTPLPPFEPHGRSSASVWPRSTVILRVSSTWCEEPFTSQVSVHCSVLPAFSSNGRVDGVTIHENLPLGGTTVV